VELVLDGSCSLLDFSLEQSLGMSDCSS
jgi:hypothetical protein